MQSVCLSVDLPLLTPLLLDVCFSFESHALPVSWLSSFSGYFSLGSFALPVSEILAFPICSSDCRPEEICMVSLLSSMLLLPTCSSPSSSTSYLSAEAKIPASFLDPLLCLTPSTNQFRSSEDPNSQNACTLDVPLCPHHPCPSAGSQPPSLGLVLSFLSPLPAHPAIPDHRYLPPSLPSVQSPEYLSKESKSDQNSLHCFKFSCRIKTKLLPYGHSGLFTV